METAENRNKICPFSNCKWGSE